MQPSKCAQFLTQVASYSYFSFVLLDVVGSIPETSSKASIYALACNPAGTVLATGSPEKVTNSLPLLVSFVSEYSQE